MQNQMRERQTAMQVAWSREFVKYFGTFFTVTTAGLTLGALKKKNPFLLAPIVPLGFVLAFQMDAAYGTLVYRLRENRTNEVIAAGRHRPVRTGSQESAAKVHRSRDGRSSSVLAVSYGLHAVEQRLEGGAEAGFTAPALADDPYSLSCGSTFVSPKSPIFTLISLSTRMFLVARSLWM
ncbi:Plasminogen receptor (KT) [Liparis tanakae]|uniref:Plasminogen receptor (KT) n=1 Tax=Liparis tanakae TaxID=230148 RepID=A0A4Z2HH49_9TELE|nr:Plasminogen receptor (KT) [Liparis tanakae]